MNKLLFNRIRMDKRLTLFIIVAIVIIVLLIALLINTVFKAGKAREEEIRSMASTGVIVEDTGSYGEFDNIEVDVTIPHFKNLKDSYNFFINNLIKERFDYKTVYKEFVAGMKNAETLKFKYNVSYERYDYYDCVSIVINEYAELQGDRPRQTKTCYVINAKESRTATLGDVFDKQDYKNRIIEEVNKQAKNKNIDFASEEGITYIPEDQSFYIKDNKLHIFYEASSVAANIYGDLDLEMPFENDKGIFVF